MAKLYFCYSCMNAGKTTQLLQSAHNYDERGMNPYLMTAQIDTRAGEGVIKSRIGIERKAALYAPDTDLCKQIQLAHNKTKIDCVFVEEAQFLTPLQVNQLTDVVDELGLPVMCYGLRNDFRGIAFPGSARLLEIADVLREIKTVCHCGKKAITQLRMNANGEVITDGSQVYIGGNESYVSVCRKHHKQGMAGI